MEFFDWPAPSPGLNSIGNLWAIMKRNIIAQIIAKSVGGLEKQLLNERCSVPQEAINELIDAMPSRVQVVIDSHGDHTKYQWLLLSLIFFCVVWFFTTVFNIEVFWWGGRVA